MFRKTLASVALVAAFTGVARASDKADVKAALQKLADSPSYTWKTTVEGGWGGAETTGKTQKDGFTTLSVTRQDNTSEAVIQGDKAAVKTDDGWKSASELVGAGGGGGGGGGGRPSPDRVMAMTAQNFKTPVALALEMVDKLDNIKKADEAYTADLSEEAVKQLMAMRRRPNANAGPQISDPKGTVKMWIKDGVITKIEAHVTATVTFNGNDNKVDRTTTTEFTDVGSTKVTVPDEAKAKLTAAAPKP
jgi:hypothetical protein